jgi:hypothetical protein
MTKVKNMAKIALSNRKETAIKRIIRLLNITQTVRYEKLVQKRARLLDQQNRLQVQLTAIQSEVTMLDNQLSIPELKVQSSIDQLIAQGMSQQDIDYWISQLS